MDNQLSSDLSDPSPDPADSGAGATIKSGLDLGMCAYWSNRAEAERGGLSRTARGEQAGIPRRKAKTQRTTLRPRTKYATTPSPSAKHPLSTEATGKLNASTAHPANPPAATTFGAAPSSLRRVNAEAFATA
ncbi:hypothetical protein A4R44_02682 [Amycolatopsis sp. M39]|nr:hypothetical protein A4R44_02682 [Amycolatopsis sp. M39]